MTLLKAKGNIQNEKSNQQNNATGKSQLEFDSTSKPEYMAITDKKYQVQSALYHLIGDFLCSFCKYEP